MFQRVSSALSLVRYGYVDEDKFYCDRCYIEDTCEEDADVVCNKLFGEDGDTHTASK